MRGVKFNFIFHLIFSVPLFSCEKSCVLPASDQLYGHSSATYSGKIFSKSDNIILAKTNDGKNYFQVDTKNIDLVSQYGGTVFLSQLQIGQGIEVWTENCKTQKGIIKPSFVLLGDTKQ